MPTLGGAWNQYRTNHGLVGDQFAFSQGWFARDAEMDALKAELTIARSNWTASVTLVKTLEAELVTARAETADLAERYRICHESAVGLRETVTKLRAETASLLEKAADLAYNATDAERVHGDIRALISTDQAAALREYVAKKINETQQVNKNASSE